MSHAEYVPLQTSPADEDPNLLWRKSKPASYEAWITVLLSFIALSTAVALVSVSIQTSAPMYYDTRSIATLRQVAPYPNMQYLMKVRKMKRSTDDND